MEKNCRDYLETLQSAFLQHKLSQSILFHGDGFEMKKELCTLLASSILSTSKEKLSNHPDYHLIVPDGKAFQISISEIKKMIDEVHTAPFQSKHKVFCLLHIDRMQLPAQNALLKILEEPNLDSYLIAITTNPSFLLPTVRSRFMSLEIVEPSDHKSKEALELLTDLSKVQNSIDHLQCLEAFEKKLSEVEPYERNYILHQFLKMSFDELKTAHLSAERIEKNRLQIEEIMEAVSLHLKVAPVLYQWTKALCQYG